MRHLHTGRKLGVSPHHRKALLRNLTLALIEKETIKISPARAKEVRWFAERIVTLAKRGDLHGRRQIVRLLGSTETKRPGENRVRNALDRVYTQLVPRFQTRPGGCTQIIRLAPRRAGDNAEMCIMRYIPDEKAGKKDKGAKAKTEKKASDKKVEDAPSDKPAKKASAKAEGGKAESKAKEPEDRPAKAKKKTKEE